MCACMHASMRCNACGSQKMRRGGKKKLESTPWKGRHVREALEISPSPKGEETKRLQDGGIYTAPSESGKGERWKDDGGVWMCGLDGLGCT